MSDTQSTDSAKESTEERFARNTRHYLSKMLIRLDDLEAEVKYPTEHSKAQERVAEIKSMALEALKAASLHGRHDNHQPTSPGPYPHRHRLIRGESISRQVA